MEKIDILMAIVLIISWILVLMLIKDLHKKKHLMKEIISSSRKFKAIDIDSMISKNDYRDFHKFIRDYNKMVLMLEESYFELEGKNIQLNSILKSVSNGIVVIDHDYRIFMINDKARSYLRCPVLENLEHRLIEEVIFEKKILRFIHQNLKKDENITREIRCMDDRIYRIKIDPISIENRKSIFIASIVNIEDITERIKLENMRREFAANVSHELKTPLTSIRGFIETLKENDSILSPDKRLRFLDIMDDESKRLNMLINDVLLLSSIESEDLMNLELFELDNMINKIERLFEPKLKKKNIRLNIENQIFSENGESKVYLPEGYMRELMINLISNAIKYNKEGGYVNVLFSKDEYNYYIDVSDSGIGISEAEKNRIFERFYRAENARNNCIEGTGLGLAIVKHIVISLGGNIDIESKLNEGSRFHISIPINKNTVTLS